MDNVDIGDVDHATYNWWMDEYDLVPKDFDAVFDRLPGSCTVIQRIDRHGTVLPPAARLVNVNYTHERLAVGGLQVEELRRWREMLKEHPVRRPAMNTIIGNTVMGNAYYSGPGVIFKAQGGALRARSSTGDTVLIGDNYEYALCGKPAQFAWGRARCERRAGHEGRHCSASAGPTEHW